jgi:hypothetical protein
VRVKLSERRDLVLSERINPAFFAMSVLVLLLSREKRSLRRSELILVRGWGSGIRREVLLTGRHRGESQSDLLPQCGRNEREDLTVRGHPFGREEASPIRFGFVPMRSLTSTST